MTDIEAMADGDVIMVVLMAEVMADSAGCG